MIGILAVRARSTKGRPHDQFKGSCRKKWEASMPYYRLYHLNRSSGHIDRLEEIDAADDVKAVAIVRECERDTAVELWQEGRKVLRLEGPTNMPPPAEPEQFRNAVAG